MRKCESSDLVITGVGLLTPIARGRVSFEQALLAGEHAFRVMERPGRQSGTAFLGAELPMLRMSPEVSERQLRTISLSAQVALLAIREAWDDARLDEVNPHRVGLIIGGSNFQQRELTRAHEITPEKLRFLAPRYGMSFLDSDLCGICTEHFGIRGMSYTVGGASASGQLAVLQAIQAVQSQQCDVVIAVGALMDLSFWECHAFRAMGAMGSDAFAAQPDAACRPFDRRRDGFIFGENCGVVVIERPCTMRPQTRAYASIAGWAVTMDAHRNPDPSCEGEARAIQGALDHAGLGACDIDYINPHGSGSTRGDETELRALRECGLTHARINATKSIVGHGLTAAGTVEIIATLVQMGAGRLHPTRNLEEPIDGDFCWVGAESVPHETNHALTLSFGFGGINTALCLSRVVN